MSSLVEKHEKCHPLFRGPDHQEAELAWPRLTFLLTLLASSTTSRTNDEFVNDHREKPYYFHSHHDLTPFEFDASTLCVVRYAIRHPYHPIVERSQSFQ